MTQEAVLHVDGCSAAHLEINDHAAYDEIKKHSLYDELFGSHAIVYGKTEEFFDAIVSAVDRGEIRLGKLLSDIPAILRF